MSYVEETSSIPVYRGAYDQGHIDGKRAMVTKAQPPIFTIVGMDDYSKGFRAGYFKRSLAAIPSKSKQAL
jgi:hypothetical protein